MTFMALFALSLHPVQVLHTLDPQTPTQRLMSRVANSLPALLSETCVSMCFSPGLRVKGQTGPHRAKLTYY